MLCICWKVGVDLLVNFQSFRGSYTVSQFCRVYMIFLVCKGATQNFQYFPILDYLHQGSWLTCYWYDNTCSTSLIPESCQNCRYKKSKSCPFCRGSLKRVCSCDLWVLTSDSDVVDKVTLDRENFNRFFHYIDSLPLVIPDNLFVFYYDYYLVWSGGVNVKLSTRWYRKAVRLYIIGC